MSENLPTKLSSRTAAFLERVRVSSRGRLAFIIDATQSRERTWDMAAQLQVQMFEEATKFGSLEVQLIYYRGSYECSPSAWTSDGHTLARMMDKVRCETGYTKIGKALAHVRKEHAQQKIDAVALVGDAMEEVHDELCGAAGTLGVPLFIFQEGDHPDASRTFAEMARLSHGAHCVFNAGAARQLADLLRAVAAYATGGVKALQNLSSDSARKLLGQIK